MPGIVPFDCDRGRVTCLVDGATGFGADVFTGLDPAVLTAAGDAALRTEFNCYLLQLQDQPLTLVDSGCGDLFGDSGGHLPVLLDQLGVTADQIGRVVLTHLHGDHMGGAFLDEQLVFGKAELVLHQDELAFWSGQDHVAARFLQAAAGQIRSVSDGAEIAPGLTTWALPGHTPGHMGLRIGTDLVLVGDISHSEALQLRDPAVGVRFDENGARARASREVALAEIAASGRIYAGGHQLGPDKFARLHRDGDTYTKVPL